VILDVYAKLDDRFSDAGTGLLTVLELGRANDTSKPMAKLMPKLSVERDKTALELCA
jgi:hypothetical protein